MIKYVYPKFDGIDLFIFRIGGSGLGNLLFPFFRALVHAKNNNLKIISPTFRSIKLGPYLRGENQKRSYNYIYNESIRGIQRLFLLIFSSKAEKKIESKILIFKSFGDGFKSLYGFEDYLKERFMEDEPEEVGCKDDFEDNFERWMMNLDAEEWIDYSNKFKRS